MGTSPPNPETVAQRVRHAATDIACVLSDLRAWRTRNAVQHGEAIDRIGLALRTEPRGLCESPWALLGEARDLAHEQNRELDALLADATRALEDLERLELDLIILNGSVVSRKTS